MKLGTSLMPTSSIFRVFLPSVPTLAVRSLPAFGGEVFA
jgi:hypothetical protein